MLGKISNSERRFEKQVNKAVTRHQRLLMDGQTSLSPSEGRLALLHSHGVTQNSVYSPDEQKELFKAEADMVARSSLASEYGDVEVRPLVNNFDMDFVIQDANVAGIVLVGHGTAAAVRMAQDEYYNWRCAERATRKLKLGHFVQRTCGALRVYQSLPLGTFIVANQRNIIAPFGVAIDDKQPDESAFVRLYDAESNTADDILALRDRLYEIGKNEHNPSLGDSPNAILDSNE